MANKTIYMFPSPFGGRVLKLYQIAINRQFPRSFRPLPGFVF